MVGDLLVNSYTMLINVYCKTSKVKEAKKLYNEMLQVRMRPSARTYGVLLKGLFQVGKVSDAKMLFGVFKAWYCANLSIYGIFLNGMCKNGCLLGAIELFNDLKSYNLKLDIEAFNRVIDGLCKVGKLEMGAF